MTMSETANRLEDVEKQISADDTALKESRNRRRETLRICRTFGGVLGTFGSGLVAMGVDNDPVEDADGGLILDRRQYPKLGPDGGGETPLQVVADRRRRRTVPRGRLTPFRLGSWHRPSAWQ
jgi:hypothetical protein